MRSLSPARLESPMRLRIIEPLSVVGVFALLWVLHYPFLRLPYFWDEAGYYVPAALDFSTTGVFVPTSTLPSGHTPLVTVYLGLLWRIFGFSPLVTRAGMLFLAAGCVVALYTLAREIAGREAALWSAALLALCPLFFAQSSLVHLDLAAALFTTLAVFALVERRMPLFALNASLAVLSKETSVILLPVAWCFPGRFRRELPWSACLWLAAPLLPLAAWALYYHHATGYWTGNREYLQFNLYSTLEPMRIFWSLLRRLYELLIGGFNWVLVAGALVGGLWRHKHLGIPANDGRSPQGAGSRSAGQARPDETSPALRGFLFLSAGLCAAYGLMLSIVGGAILPRYLLPVFPLFFLSTVIFVWQLPKALARSICLGAATCFVVAWFLNPPYPFPFEDNLSYADFIRLHEQAARFLESGPGAERGPVPYGSGRDPRQTGFDSPRILTAWPASDELTRPFLGYVHKPLRVVALRGFTDRDFKDIPPESFDLLYLYSRKWEPRHNWLARFPQFLRMQERYFDYAPQIGEEVLVTRYGLKLLWSAERRGQWAWVYSK